jgi:hypothetical protein
VAAGGPTHRSRTPRQHKRALRNDHRRRRRILERAQADPTLTANAVRVLGLLLEASDTLTTFSVVPSADHRAISSDGVRGPVIG